MEFFQVLRSVYFTLSADLLVFLQCQDNQLISQTPFFLVSNLLTPWISVPSDLRPTMRTYSNLLSSQCKFDFINTIITDIKLHYNLLSGIQFSFISFFFFSLAKQIPVPCGGLDVLHKLSEWYVLMMCVFVDTMYWQNTKDESEGEKNTFKFNMRKDFFQS